MSILLLRSDNKYDAWLKALKEENADLPVFTPETLKNRDEVKMILSWKAPKGSYSHYPNVEVIGSMGAGVDHLFQDDSLPENVKISRIVDDYLKNDMREFILTLVMDHLKNLGSYVKFQQKNSWKQLPYQSVPNVTIGFMGLGVLGQAAAEYLHRLDFKVTGWSNSKKDLDFVKSFAGKEGLDDFLASAEILVCLLPLTEETKDILNAELFKKLPDGAYLINVARGGHLVEQDLTEALAHDKLSGAALDVFQEEPLPEDHPFWKNNKILITPHVASVSSPSSVAGQVIDNYNRMLNGEPLRHTVSRKRGY
jgi:glyoxylate/hydroxypyruvate reductase A